MASTQNASQSLSSESDSDSIHSNSNSKSIVPRPTPTPTDASRVQTIPKTFKAQKKKRAVGGKRKRAADAEEEEGEKSEKPAGRSWVWEHFKKIDKPVFEVKDGKKIQTSVIQRAKYNYCGTDLACDSYGNGTSSLRRHIQDVCKKYPGRVDLEVGQQVLSTRGTKELVMIKWSQDACKEAACKMIVMDDVDTY